MNIKQTIYDQFSGERDSPSLPPSGSSPRQSRNLIKTEDSGGRQAAGTASASRGQPSGKIWRKKMEGSDFRERVMPTRAFCSFNPEWDIFHQERAETETDIYSSWYFSTLPPSLFLSLQHWFDLLAGNEDL